MDPVIQQIARARSIEPHFLRKMKEHFLGVVQPQLDERERLLEENATLRQAIANAVTKADLDKLKKQIADIVKAVSA